VGAKEFDLFYIIKNTAFSYDTLEGSEINKINHEEIKKKKAILKAKKKKNKKINKKTEKEIIKSVMSAI
jgi:hypothetical protein